jgi:hypothetical protein
MYVYGDYCSGEIWAAGAQGGAWTPVPLPIETETLTTFGEDVAGELYVGTETGFLYRIDSAGPQTPLIGTISPDRGFERGGDRVTITGAGFAGGAEVLFGAAPAAAVIVVSPTELTAITPSLPEGAVDVSVSNPGAPPAVRTGGFVYVEMPRVTTPTRETRVVTRSQA